MTSTLDQLVDRYREEAEAVLFPHNMQARWRIDAQDRLRRSTRTHRLYRRLNNQLPRGRVFARLVVIQGVRRDY